ncbi:hypothetical protein PTS98_23600, partial [Serratia nevei]|uniref:hypothetical protein n=1 Tax=Serratia nevei TaxID=2703794 RepID=UPI00313C5DBF
RYDNAQRCPQGEATGRINPARPTNSEKSAFWRFFRFCRTHFPFFLFLIHHTLRYEWLSFWRLEW